MARPEKTETEAPRRAIEAWAEEKRAEAWRLAAARAMRGWAIGRELTEQEFDAAMKAAGEIRIGYDLSKE